MSAGVVGLGNDTFPSVCVTFFSGYHGNLIWVISFQDVD